LLQTGEQTGERETQSLQIGAFVGVSKTVSGGFVRRGFKSLPLRSYSADPVGCTNSVTSQDRSICGEDRVYVPHGTERAALVPVLLGGVVERADGVLDAIWARVLEREVELAKSARALRGDPRIDETGSPPRDLG
jgi:hypothetical protein